MDGTTYGVDTVDGTENGEDHVDAYEREDDGQFDLLGIAHEEGSQHCERESSDWE